MHRYTGARVRNLFREYRTDRVINIKRGKRWCNVNVVTSMIMLKLTWLTFVVVISRLCFVQRDGEGTFEDLAMDAAAVANEGTSVGWDRVMGVIRLAHTVRRCSFFFTG